MNIIAFSLAILNITLRFFWQYRVLELLGPLFMSICFNETMTNSTRCDSMNKTLFLLLPLSIILVGCGTPKTVKLNLNYVTKDSVPIEAIDKNSQINMAESSTSISQSLQQLAAITQASHPDLRIPDTYNAGELHMTERTSISWTGPVEPLLQKVAKAAHYELVIVGAEPVIPVLVAIDKRDKPLADIFHDIRYQIVDKAQILVFPSKNIIELRYMPN